MSGADVFFDTNILLYLRSDEPAKLRRSEEILDRGGVISVQVLNEFANVARRKYKLEWPAVRAFLTLFRATLRVVPLTVETHARGIALSERYGFSVHDAMVVAAAELAGCKVLYTEDMHDGLVIGGLTLRNPYK